MSPIEDPVAATEAWLRDFVVRLDLCPFAAAPLRAGRVRVVESRGESLPEMLAELLGEVTVLQEDGAATTLFVVPTLLADWDDFQDVMVLIDQLLESTDHDQFAQVVGFHPDYVFGDAPAQDPAHATNRSPYPMVHLLVRAEVAAAVASHPDVAGIPARNVALLREMAEPG